MSPKPQRGAPPAAQSRSPRFDEEEDPALEDDGAAIGDVVERPDGYHWVSADGRHEFGPFATLAEAQADMDGFAGSADAAGVLDAEEAIDINDWDDDLGAPGELHGGIDDD